MNQRVDRRNVLKNATIWAGCLGVGLNISGVRSAKAGILGNNVSAFETILRNSTGAVAAAFSDFAVQSPEGTTCTARLAYPLVLNKKLPVLVFCPDEGANASQYDQLTGALAAQDYFVLTIDRRPLNIQAARSFLTPEQQGENRLRRFAEVRFLLDTIDAAAAALGPKAELVDATRVGAMGCRCRTL